MKMYLIRMNEDKVHISNMEILKESEKMYFLKLPLGGKQRILKTEINGVDLCNYLYCTDLEYGKMAYCNYLDTQIKNYARTLKNYQQAQKGVGGIRGAHRLDCDTAEFSGYALQRARQDDGKSRRSEGDAAAEFQLRLRLSHQSADGGSRPGSGSPARRDC